LDLDVGVDREQYGEPVLLLGDEQVGAGVQGPAGCLERVALAAAVAVDGLLHSAPAFIEGLTGAMRHRLR
jgi:hypothetical protein